MNKCLKIIFNAKLKDAFLKNVVQKTARKFDLEGLAQVINSESVKIVLCGEKNNIDLFLDVFYKEIAKAKISDYELEPFLKDRDYRGVFRIIE